ncbi:MAG: glucuronate isomerase [Provencibacterium sp.]|jgi:glucuronate isomerase|nr:glucuronate isomerase [Provencibacterium sp.]
MKPFMNEDFLLQSETAKTLYHDYAAKMPIIDYHCHINPQEIAENRQFENITQVWLGGDHYKWRLIRANGADENEVTGSADDRVKFQRFAEALPRAIGNPLYHWTHLELKRYFGCDLPINADTAEEIWNLCNEKLKTPALSVRGIIEQSNVRAIATTDDPADSLIWHQKIKDDPTCKVTVVPAFRPDKAVNLEKPGFAEYIATLGKAADVSIQKIDDLYAALEKRIAFFDEMGCRASDHGLDYCVCRPDPENKADAIFQKALKGEKLTVEEVEIYKTALLGFFGRQYHKHGWVMQIHYNALRNNNTRMFERLGPDTGYDAIASYNCTAELMQFLNSLEVTGELPKMVLYSLNPNDNAALDAIAGTFQSPEIPGKIQHGSAWWFNDTLKGMEEQLRLSASIGVIGNFIGMLTDSRSFLSYTRHEYFRRLVCNIIGGWVENGEYPADMAYLGQMVQDISYNNTARFFGFDK